MFQVGDILKVQHILEGEYLSERHVLLAEELEVNVRLGGQLFNVIDLDTGETRIGFYRHANEETYKVWKVA